MAEGQIEFFNVPERNSLSFKVFCPACDKPFVSRLSKVEAMTIMRAHLKKCNPDMLDSTRD